MPQGSSQKPQVESKSFSLGIGMQRLFQDVKGAVNEGLSQAKQELTNWPKIDLNNLSLQPIDKVEGEQLAMDLLQTTPGFSLGAGLAGIIGGPVGRKALSNTPFIKEVKNFTSKFFGDRFEINPPKELLDKFKKGEISKKVSDLHKKREDLFKEYGNLVDKVPDNAYNKDFSIDYTKLDRDLAKKLKAAEEARHSINPKVSDIISPEDFPALAKAYPDIFDTSFQVVNKIDTKSAGSYLAMGKDGKIIMNLAKMTDNKLQDAEAFFHELQHAVQHKEFLAAEPNKSFAFEYGRELKKVLQAGSKDPKSVSWEAEAYDSGLRDAYPQLRDMPIETATK